ncbi:putative membrane protein YteJ [Robertmurraya siralis]|uniref:Membrane protein YteJ n=1 Tax=Robertmurraya siralis TaxID=77777 RepID=A0A919WDW3_9BACI|nr:putative membrane protein YteJ [Robertmurraya siralis]
MESKDIQVEKQITEDKEERVVPHEAINGNVRYAGFWMRFWAYLIDLLVIGSINRILIYPVFRSLDLSLHDSSMFAPISIFTAITFYAYFVLMTKFLGQTLGKMIFGLKVVDLNGKKLSWGAILFREWIGRFISTTVWISYAVVAFLPKKQGLHDLFADTSVVHER